MIGSGELDPILAIGIFVVAMAIVLWVSLRPTKSEKDQGNP